jgi:DNA topoisomerase III
MNKSLILAEKPSVARDIARVLKCNIKGNGCLEGGRFIVTWALGHLVTLAEPEYYNEKYKKWSLEDIPMLPSHLKLIVIKKTRKQFNSVTEHMKRKDIGEIIIATDAGREGELVARWIIEKANVKKPIKRLWISSVTDKAIFEGFNKLKDGKKYEKLYESAAARAEADWIVGINATRALTCKFNAQLSCGRVQTPTLSMIAKREKEILNFKPVPFYGIALESGKLKMTWQDAKTKDNKTFDRKKRDSIIDSIKGKGLIITKVAKTPKKNYPPQLYNLTSLQRDANRIFDFSASETLSIMQRLYETHKLLTYPRTDSNHISVDIVDTIKDRLKACTTGSYAAYAARVLRAPLNINKNFVDDSKVTDHHAIIPTEQTVFLDSLSDRERKIYDLVVKRFLSALLPPMEYEQTEVNAKIGNEIFITKGKKIISKGWKEIYENTSYLEDERKDSSEIILPGINTGDTLEVTSISPTQGQTKPPAPFNEGSLLAAMENPVRYMDTERNDLIKTINEAGGIGTVATRADIIEKLFNNFLIKKSGKNIFITSKGSQLLDIVPGDLKSPVLTARWEQKLDAISKGTIDKKSFINDMKNYTIKIVSDIKHNNEVFRHDNITMNRCPQCGKFMLEVQGKKGKMLICQDRECGYRKSLTRVSNARCPQCHKKMEIHGEGEDQTFFCVCGYREKLSTYLKNRKKESEKLSKQEVNRFINKQKKKENENINNALAQALADIKDKL